MSDTTNTHSYFQNFDSGLANYLTESVMDWDEGQIVPYKDRYLAFFRADGKNPDLKKVLDAMINHWNKDDQKGERRVRDQGFILINPEDMQRRTQKALEISDKSLLPIVGIVAADPHVLARQFDYARTVLHALGVCNDNLPMRMKVGIDRGDLTSLKNTLKRSVSAKATYGLEVKAPINPIVEASVGAESTFETGVEMEQTRSTELDYGAVKSALFLNRIAEESGIRNLTDLIALGSQRKMSMRSFEKGRDPEVQIDNITRTLQHLQEERDTLLQNIEDTFSHGVRNIRTNWKGENSRYKEFQVKVTQLEYAFQDVIEECKRPGIDSSSFDITREIDEVGKTMTDSGRWFGRMGEFGAHAMILAACYNEEIRQQEEVLEQMRQSMGEKERIHAVPAA